MTRQEEIGGYFTRHHHDLLNQVRGAARAPDQTLEDACSYAWTQLLRRNDIDLDGLGAFYWLRQVAVREAWRLQQVARRVTLLEPDALARNVDTHPVAEDHVDDHVATLDKLDTLAELTPRHRELLALQAAGYSYQEICQITGTSYTAVNRHITLARANLRQLVATERSEPRAGTTHDVAEGGENRAPTSYTPDGPHPHPLPGPTRPSTPRRSRELSEAVGLAENEAAALAEKKHGRVPVVRSEGSPPLHVRGRSAWDRP